MKECNAGFLSGFVIRLADKELDPGGPRSPFPEERPGKPGNCCGNFFMVIVVIGHYDYYL